jgi:hypothetical protein
MEMGWKELETRLAALEKQNRRLRRGAVLLGLGALAALLAGAARPRSRVVTATEFRLVDSKGTVKGSFLADKNGPVLALRDAMGRARARVSVGADGAPRVELADSAEKVRAALALGPAGSPELAFTDESARERAGLRVTPAGLPRFDLSDGAGKNRASLGVDSEGEAAVSLADADANPRAALSVESDGSPRLKLSDADGAPRASLGRTPLTETHSGRAKLTEPSSLILFDARGRVVFMAPK